MYPDPNVSFHHYFAGLATLANDVDAGRQLHVGYALTSGRCGAVQTVDDPAVGGGGSVGEVALHLERVILVSFSIIWLKLISRTVPGS